MDRMELDWSDLSVFLAVARCGSLAKAASKLNVTHSTIFRRINSLESAVGVKLFTRLPEGYRLTAIGTEVLGHVEQVSGLIDELQRLLENQNDTPQGTINVTAPHNLAYRYLPPFVAEFRRLYPGIHINLIVSNDDLNLSRREADLAIRATSAPPEHLIAHKLCSLAWGAYASATYLAEHGAPSDETSLRQHSIISAHESLLRLPAYNWVDRNVSQQRIVARCNDLVSMSALAAAGVGIALLPDDQAKPALERLFTFAPGKHSDLWVLTHPDLRDNRRLALFKTFIIEKFGNGAVFKEH